MRYLTYFFVLLLTINVCFAEKKTAAPAFVDPNDEGGAYIDPYDIGGSVDPNDQDGGAYIDPYDMPSVIEEAPKKQPNDFEVLKDDLMAKARVYKQDAGESWRMWKQINIDDPKPPIVWSQVGTELGAGYVGAFGGSIVGMFSGFLVGSIYDSTTSCEQCWVDIAFSMSTIGATLGGSAGVYMFGNNDKQLGSAALTYAGTLLPLMIGAVAYSDSGQINKSGFYLVTIPLMAGLGFNWSRHFRKKGEEPLFNNFFEPDDMWVSKDSDNVMALNVRYKF